MENTLTATTATGWYQLRPGFATPHRPGLEQRPAALDTAPSPHHLV